MCNDIDCEPTFQEILEENWFFEEYILEWIEALRAENKKNITEVKQT